MAGGAHARAGSSCEGDVFRQRLRGSMLVTGTQAEAVLEMICVEQKWRGRGVASALVDEALVQLSKQQVPHIVRPRRPPQRQRDEVF